MEGNIMFSAIVAAAGHSVATASLRLFVVAFLAALSCAVAADAVAKNGLSRATAGMGSRKVLPPTREPRPYRQTVIAPCADGICVMKFAKVDAFRLLEILNIACVNSGDSNDLILFRSGNWEVTANKVVAFLGRAHGNVSLGPYYFDAGERPTIVTGGPDDPAGAACSISGKLWRTD